MAIIKKLKRLGSTVRGARTGYAAAFDSDGNIITSSRTIAMIPTAPGSGNIGKVWTAKTAVTGEWAKQIIDVTNEFTVNTSVTTSYFMAYRLDNFVFVTFSVNNTSGEAITSLIIATTTTLKPSTIQYGSATSPSYSFIHTNGNLSLGGTLASGVSAYGFMIYVL